MPRQVKWLTGIALTLLALGAFLVWLEGRAWQFVLGPEAHYFDSAGVRIHYTDEGQGMPVVLMHGLAFTANLEWRRTGIVDALARGYRVITLDARGHGRSGKPHDPAQYGTQMVEDIVRLLDHLNIDKAHVVGLSMGGYITLKLAATHPDRLLSVAPCAAGWESLTEDNLAFGEDVARSLEQGKGIGRLSERVGLEGRFEALAVNLGIGHFNDAQALAAVLRGFPQLAVSEDALKENRVPALTIVGSEDGFLPMAKALAARMSHHTLQVISGKNHMNIAECDAFIEVLQAFLASHSPGASAPNGYPAPKD